MRCPNCRREVKIDGVIDNETIRYLNLTARTTENIELVSKYSKEQGLFVENHQQQPNFSEIIELDISTIKPSLAGPKRPQDRIDLVDSSASFNNFANELKIENINQQFI
mgnify:CR=1 FL=1